MMGLAVAGLPLKAAVLLVGGAIFLTLVLVNPTLSLYVLIPIIPFSSLLAVSIGGVKAGVMELVLALALVAGLLKILASRTTSGHSFKIITGPLGWPFLILLGAVSLSWLNSLSIGASLVETAKWIEMFGVYLFIINLLPARHIKWLVLTFILAGTAQALLGLYQFIFKVGPAGFLLFNGRFLRAHGTFAQPNPYAGYLGLVLPLVLSLTIWVIEQNPEFIIARLPSLPKTHIRLASQLGRKIVGELYRLLKLALFGLPLGLLLAALFASQSRGAWLGFATAAIATLIVRSKKFAVSLSMLVLIGVFIGVISSIDLRLPQQVNITEAGSAYAVMIQRLAEAAATLTTADVATTPVTDANFATIERLAHWQAAREMWRDNPWLGVGFGNYAVVYPVYAVGRWLDPLGHAHNYLLNIGAETGLVGIVAYSIFWIFTFGLLWLVIQHFKGFNSFHKAVATGGLGIIVHLHIHNLVDNLYVQGLYLHVAIILGLISVIYRHDKQSQTSKNTRKSHVLHHQRYQQPIPK
jgi:O-antigen ligase